MILWVGNKISEGYLLNSYQLYIASLEDSHATVYLSMMSTSPAIASAMPLRVCVCTSNRSDYSKLQPLMRKLKADPEFELCVLAMGSHLLEECGLTYTQIEADGFTIDCKVCSVSAWLGF